MPARMTQQEFEDRVKNYTNDSVEVISQYQNKRTHVQVRCRKCGYEWEVSPATFMPSSMKNTSFIGCPECKYKEVECEYCHKKFRRLKSELDKNKSGYVYCSVECGNRHKSEQITTWSNGTSYRRNAFNAYEHKCAICGYDEDERILEVHHIDEDRDNNELSNLIILCPICHKKLTLHLYSLEELQK